MNIVLFDTPQRTKLYPLTLTRAVAGIRMGIFSIQERWERLTNKTAYVLTDPSIQSLYGVAPPGDYIFIDASVKPDDLLVESIQSLKQGEVIVDTWGVVAGRAEIEMMPGYDDSLKSLFSSFIDLTPKKRLEHPFEIVQWNDELIRFDFNLLSKNRSFLNVRESVSLENVDKIFIEEGAQLDHCILNASSGPIFIGKNATVLEGSSIRGPFALCEGATVKMGARVYGATTVGPYSVIGGEVKNSVFFGFSNKAHGGYIGDSIIGEWCNLGAGTSNSNVKNTASEVMVWSFFVEAPIAAGIKCGVIMGDYSRTAINTSINTGTVIGVCCNVFGEGLTPKLLPDFSWGMNGPIEYEFDKALKDISNWKKLKNRVLLESEATILRYIFENSRISRGFN